jgi:uncharacterized membrane protein YgaE (UPF0421/DUF939 family)
MWALIIAAVIGPIAIGITFGVVFGYNWLYLCLLSLVTIPLCRTIFVFNKIKDNNNAEENGTEEDDGSNDQE